MVQTFFSSSKRALSVEGFQALLAMQLREAEAGDFRRCSLAESPLRFTLPLQRIACSSGSALSLPTSARQRPDSNHHAIELRRQSYQIEHHCDPVALDD
jgi:hypothetical protein